MGVGRNIKKIWYGFVFCVLFIPYLLIDLYHVATEVPEWEKNGK